MSRYESSSPSAGVVDGRRHLVTRPWLIFRERTLHHSIEVKIHAESRRQRFPGRQQTHLRGRTHGRELTQEQHLQPARHVFDCCIAAHTFCASVLVLKIEKKSAEITLLQRVHPRGNPRRLLTCGLWGRLVIHLQHLSCRLRSESGAAIR